VRTRHNLVEFAVKPLVLSTSVLVLVFTSVTLGCGDTAYGAGANINIPFLVAEPSSNFATLYSTLMA